MSGRSEGKQVETTAIEGSAAVQIQIGTKSSVAMFYRNTQKAFDLTSWSEAALTGNIRTMILS